MSAVGMRALVFHWGRKIHMRRGRGSGSRGARVAARRVKDINNESGRGRVVLGHGRRRRRARRLGVLTG